MKYFKCLPVWILSPISSSDIFTDFPFSRLTWAVDGKQMFSKTIGGASVVVVVIVGGTKQPVQHGNTVSAVASGHRVPQLSHEPLTVDMLQQYSFPFCLFWHLCTFWSVHTDVSWNYQIWTWWILSLDCKIKDKLDLYRNPKNYKK